MIESVLYWLYLGCAILLALYTLGQGVVLWQYWRHRHHHPTRPPLPKTWPHVTVQLPLYNEQHVVKRLLEAITQLDYPAEKLHIQILDDSTDVTSRLVAAQCWRYPHLDIRHLRRPDRQGYKAGALAHGLRQTDSAFVAIFDADFLPPSDFLKRTVPYLLADDTLGVVQTRWGHLNADANWLTQAQRLSVDAHFVIEQTGRNRNKWLIPFNGTGGVWRAKTIRNAGGWLDRTLTEDLDLSFRAQMQGWRALMLPDVVVPGELPPHITAYRQQQARWARGNTQGLRQLWMPLWRSGLPLDAKIMGLHHLCQYLPQVLMLLLLLLAPPLMVTGILENLSVAPLGFVSLIPPLMYGMSQRASYPTWKTHLMAFPALVIVGTGLIGHNSIAVLQGLAGVGGEFKRTPKFARHWQRSNYALQSIPLLEMGLMLYAAWATWLATLFLPVLVPYLLLYMISFAGVTISIFLERQHNAHDSILKHHLE